VAAEDSAELAADDSAELVTEDSAEVAGDDAADVAGELAGDDADVLPPELLLLLHADVTSSAAAATAARARERFPISILSSPVGVAREQQRAVVRPTRRIDARASVDCCGRKHIAGPRAVARGAPQQLEPWP
jgi:hypothetical protein